MNSNTPSFTQKRAKERRESQSGRERARHERGEKEGISDREERGERREEKRREEKRREREITGRRERERRGNRVGKEKELQMYTWLVEAL
jgi:hypothetical protein